MLPTPCDPGRVNGYAKSRHGIANGANDGGWGRPSDAVGEKKGNENESAVNVSASAVDAKDKERT
jgi:hypothetical protein